MVKYGDEFVSFVKARKAMDNATDAAKTVDRVGGAIDGATDAGKIVDNIGDAGKTVEKTSDKVKSGSKAIDTLKNDEIATLYRAVSPEEFYSIVEKGKFTVTERTMQAKQFGLNFEETLRYADTSSDYAAIVKIEIPMDVLNEIADFTNVDSSIFRQGTITIDGIDLELFNQAIKEITQSF